MNVTLDLGDGPKPYRREIKRHAAVGRVVLVRTALTSTPRTRTRSWTPSRALLDGFPRAEARPVAWTSTSAVSSTRSCHVCIRPLLAQGLFDLGHVSSEEPIHRLFQPGLHPGVRGTATTAGQPVPAADVVERDGGYWYEDEQVAREYGKMARA